MLRFRKLLGNYMSLHDYNSHAGEAFVIVTTLKWIMLLVM